MVAMTAVAEPAGTEKCAMNHDYTLRVVAMRARPQGEPHVTEKLTELRGIIEKVFASFLETFRFVSDIQEAWREDVFRGITKYSPEQDAAIRAYFNELVSGDQEVQRLRAELKKHGHKGAVKGLGEYQRILRKVKRILATWEAPELSIAMGLRHQKFDREQTAQLREILNSGSD
jgi:hypothetical protein